MKAENKETKYKPVSISCYFAIRQMFFLVKDVQRQHSYCNLQSNKMKLSLMFYKYFA